MESYERFRDEFVKQLNQLKQGTFEDALGRAIEHDPDLWKEVKQRVLAASNYLGQRAEIDEKLMVREAQLAKAERESEQRAQQMRMTGQHSGRGDLFAYQLMESHRRTRTPDRELLWLKEQSRHVWDAQNQYAAFLKLFPGDMGEYVWEAASFGGEPAQTHAAPEPVELPEGLQEADVAATPEADPKPLSEAAQKVQQNAERYLKKFGIVPTYDQLVVESGISKPTVCKAVKELCAAGLWKERPRTGGQPSKRGKSGGRARGR